VLVRALDKKHEHDGITLGLRRRQHKSTELKQTHVDCLRFTTPHCLCRLYGMNDATGTIPHPNSSLGIFTMAWQTWLGLDLDMFFTDFAPSQTGKRPFITVVNGGYRHFDLNNANNTATEIFHLEPNLDYQYTMALADPVPVTNIQVGDELHPSSNTNMMLAALDQNYYCSGGLDGEFDSPIYNEGNNNNTTDNYCNNDNNKNTERKLKKIPRVLSISYAWNEAEFSPPYLHRQCLEFLKLGLQGITVLASTGDYGTADQLGNCIDEATGAMVPFALGNNETRTGAGGVRFSAVFPASCPWVTAVGGTQFALPPSVKDRDRPGWMDRDMFPAETALDIRRKGKVNVSSGGGFSWTFTAPGYQAGVARDYLDRVYGAAGNKYFNPQNRGYPDISAMARSYVVAMHGKYHSVDGTSASAPLLASMIARINDERLKQGKGTVGFINPVLYSRHHEMMIRDIDTGVIGGCGVADAFPAKAGWDAATGLGSPDYEGMRRVFMSFP